MSHYSDRCIKITIEIVILIINYLYNKVNNEYVNKVKVEKTREKYDVRSNILDP